MATPPKEAIHALYGRPQRRKIISVDDYCTWYDDGPPHDIKYTSIFCCPLTYEVFPSGSIKDTLLPDNVRKHSEIDEGTGQIVVWYSRKIWAEHAAAARAYDCILSRETPIGEFLTTERYCDDEAYPNETQMSFPSSTPINFRRSVEGKRRQRNQEFVHDEEEEDGSADALALGAALLAEDQPGVGISIGGDIGEVQIVDNLAADLAAGVSDDSVTRRSVGSEASISGLQSL